uniref:Uncharacterized protein n=1 Tax=Sus scrofa TaxID=9823 RepID=A0A4X1T4P0_PIG
MCPDLLLHPPTADSRSTHGKAARVSVVWSIPSPGKTAKPVPPGSPSPRAGRLSSAVPCLPPREFCSLLPQPPYLPLLPIRAHARAAESQVQIQLTRYTCWLSEA